jgi:hypothetical protein
MALIINVNVPKFDSDIIKQSDAIRVRRATEQTMRNGIVTRVTDTVLEIVVGNIQNSSTSFMQLHAGDVAIGVWEIWWTTDFKDIMYNAPASIGGGP